MALFGVIIFMIFGSGDLAEWAVLPDEQKSSDSKRHSLQVQYHPVYSVLTDTNLVRDCYNIIKFYYFSLSLYFFCLLGTC